MTTDATKLRDWLNVMYRRQDASKITQWDLDHMSPDHLADMLVELMGSQEANDLVRELDRLLKQEKAAL